MPAEPLISGLISSSLEISVLNGVRVSEEVNLMFSNSYEWGCDFVTLYRLATASRRFFRVKSGLLAALFIVVFGSVVSVRAQEAAPSEAQVKAAFLLNFAKYVEWPPSAFPETGKPIVVGIFDDDEVAREFSVMSEKRTVEGHPFQLVRITTPEQCRACHIVFIGFSQTRRCADLLPTLRASDILTVGENDDFMDLGGMINLTQRERRIAIEVNMESVRASKLKVSSKLLALATLKGGKR